MPVRERCRQRQRQRGWSSCRLVLRQCQRRSTGAPEHRSALASSPSVALCLSVALSLCLSVSLCSCAWQWCGGVVWGEEARVCACVRACTVAMGECGRLLATPSCRRDLAHSVQLGACQPGLGHGPCRAVPAPHLQLACTAQACTRSTGGPACVPAARCAGRPDGARSPNSGRFVHGHAARRRKNGRGSAALSMDCTTSASKDHFW